MVWWGGGFLGMDSMIKGNGELQARKLLVMFYIEGEVDEERRMESEGWLEGVLF